MCRLALEAGDKDVRDLWATMNEWVLDGFDQTYKSLGISFDKVDHESDTYLLGKELVQKGLDMGVFVKDPDGSVWCDLASDGLDRKLVLRGDGTSVYITQDLGTAERRFREYDLDKHIYVVGNEQDYHFQVLKLILSKLGFPWAKEIYHLSYGMVELPDGKMKSREGTVVDADDLIEKMYREARSASIESGKLEDVDDEEKEMLRKEYCYLQENVLVERKQQLEETMELIKTMKRDAEEAYSFTLSEIARYAADVKQGTREIRLRSTDTFCIALNGYYLTYVWDDDNQIFILAKAVPVADRSEIWSNESMNREAFLNAFGIEYPEVEKKEESLEMPFD